ncbi:hypothetical protein H9P43_006172 [Blastocladiella emersonii ATCC 22665]|nr:hypothetical protein H9P43_006172 [Blastocladiella emersonii ATCC 22665]
MGQSQSTSSQHSAHGHHGAHAGAGAHHHYRDRPSGDDGLLSPSAYAFLDAQSSGGGVPRRGSEPSLPTSSTTAGAAASATSPVDTRAPAIAAAFRDPRREPSVRTTRPGGFGSNPRRPRPRRPSAPPPPAAGSLNRGAAAGAGAGGPVDISNPTNVEQGIHIEWDEETGTFRGVPAPWRAAFERQLGPAVLGMLAPANSKAASGSGPATPVRVESASAAERTVPMRSATAPVEVDAPPRIRSTSSSSNHGALASLAHRPLPPPIAPADRDRDREREREREHRHRRNKSSETNNRATTHSPSPHRTAATAPREREPRRMASSQSLNMTTPNKVPRSPGGNPRPTNLPPLTRPEKSAHRRTPSSGSAPASPSQQLSPASSRPQLTSSASSASLAVVGGGGMPTDRRPSDGGASSPARRPSNTPSIRSRSPSRGPPPVANPRKAPPATPPPTAPLPDRPLARPVPIPSSSSDDQPIRARRVSARRSRVLSISPRGSLLSTGAVMAALAAAAMQREEENARASSTRASRDSTMATLDDPDATVRAPVPPPRSTSSSGRAATIMAAEKERRRSAVVLQEEPEPVEPEVEIPAALAEAFHQVTIHPALQRFIAEAQRMEREQQEARAAGKQSDAAPQPNGVATASSLVQLLQDGALGEAGRELAALTSMRVTPATLAVALAPMVESGDPHAVFANVVPYAEGASGDVHTAKDTVVHCAVAIKIVPRDHPRSADKIARLPLELHLMRASRHPNVVSFIGAYLTDDAVWIAMEFMDAGCLADFLYADEEDEEGGELVLAAPGIAYITAMVARALEYLHAAHRLHRDVRSDNVLLTGRGDVKLGDFGYATEAHAPLTEPVGTPYWMAPEVAAAGARAFAEPGSVVDDLDEDADKSQYGSAVDVWALGVTVFEMAARMYPYADLDEVAALRAIARNGCPDLDPHARDRLGDKGVAFWRRATAKDPSMRPTAAEMLRDDAFLVDADLDAGRRQVVAMVRPAAGATASSSSSARRPAPAAAPPPPPPPPVSPAAAGPVVVVAIGQCGITIAHEFFTLLGDPSRHPRFFAAMPPSSSSSARDTPPPPPPPAPAPASGSGSGMSVAEREARIRRALLAAGIVPSSPAPLPPPPTSPPPPSHHQVQWIPRCVLLDTEAKVIRTVLREGGPRYPTKTSPRAWRYHPKCAQWRAAGAANNWAYGYYRHGKDMYAAIARGIRAQVRLAGDGFAGFVVLHSLAGGTGSGVGTYVTEQLRREFPTAAVVNHVVWPFMRGEVIVQNYNMVLTLARLLEASDMVLVQFNDHLQRIGTERLGLPSASFADLNRIMARVLFHILAPAKVASSSSSPASTTTLVDLVRTATCGAWKLATAYHVPQVPAAAVAFTALTWPALLRPLRQMVLTHTPTDERLDWAVEPGAAKAARVGAAVVIVKGADKRAAEAELVRLFGDARMYDGTGASGKPAAAAGGARWRVWVDRDTQVPGIDKWAAVVCTSSAAAEPLEETLRIAVQMYRTGAFLHQYAKFGLPAGAMAGAISRVYQELERYKTDAY